MADLSNATKLLIAWVKLSGMIKNNRITKGLQYNEATVMLLLYRSYMQDGEGLISVKEIISETGMLKSLANRTINSLEAKGLVTKCQGEKDKRTIFVKCVTERLDTFLEVHNSSLDVAKGIVDIIGEEDTEHFIRIVNKIDLSGYRL